MNIIQKLEQEQIAKLSAQRGVPEFGPGDTVRVSVKVVEGTRERLQAFEGVCIGRSGGGVNASFTVRKISFGEGVERVFPLYSPRIANIEVVRRGDVRRAKLYYLRGLRGKKARITEKAGTGAGAASAAELSEQELLEGAPQSQAAETGTPAETKTEKRAEAQSEKKGAEKKAAKGDTKGVKKA